MKYLTSGQLIPLPCEEPTTPSFLVSRDIWKTFLDIPNWNLTLEKYNEKQSRDVVRVPTSHNLDSVALLVLTYHLMAGRITNNIMREMKRGLYEKWCVKGGALFLSSYMGRSCSKLPCKPIANGFQRGRLLRFFIIQYSARFEILGNLIICGFSTKVVPLGLLSKSEHGFHILKSLVP